MFIKSFTFEFSTLHLLNTQMSLDNSPTPMHFIQEVIPILNSNGYREVKETGNWSNIPSKFYVIRDNSNIVVINKKDLSSGVIVSTHLDSPCLKIKPNSRSCDGHFEQLRVSTYGTGNWYTWTDRALRVAGRAIYENGEGNIQSGLFFSRDPVAIIPSTTSCFDSKSDSFNLEERMSPIIALSKLSEECNQLQSEELLNAIGKELNIDKSKILDFEASLVDANNQKTIGTEKDLIVSSRISSLLPSITAFNEFIKSGDPGTGLRCFVGFNNGENGDCLRTGAKSNLLPLVLQSIGCNDYFYENTIVINNLSIPVCLNSKTKEDKQLLGSGLYYFNEYNEVLSKFTVSLKQYIQPPKYTKEIVNPLNKYDTDFITIGIPVLGLNSIRETCNTKDLNELKKFYELLFK